jgi:diguanylate cyclase (GGDEF)-like protein/putative nucleotidyltransferase with HDIG domain
MALWNSQEWGQLNALRRPTLSGPPAGRKAPAHDAAGVRPALPAELAVQVLAYAMGALAVVVALLGLFPAPDTQSTGLIALAGVGFVAAVAIEVLADRIPLAALAPLTGFGAGLIGLALYMRGDTATPYALLFLFPVMFGFGFLRRPAAIGVLAVAIASYAGALFAQSDRPPEPFEAWAVACIGLLCVGAAVGWGRARYERECAQLASAARTDPLTGLVNRRGFEESFELELERARRSGSSFSLVVGDLDGFKQVNDRYGHHVGDLALERVSRVLMRRKRRIDTVARLGGEEFALLVPDATNRASYMLAERLRAAVGEEFAPGPEHLTVSFGVASYPEHGDSYESLLGAADDALYAAKELGRDRTVIFSREVPGILAPGGRNSERNRRIETLLTLAEGLDLSEASAPRHSRRVGRYAALIARELGLPDELVERVRLAGVLHDVGKIALPDPMLSKPEPLTNDEWVEMRRHPEVGAHMLANAQLADIARWVLAHHERPDGRGFPRGLADGDIPLEARILAVADAYVAMTSERPYRQAMEHEAARAELRKHIGGQFDERVVEAFIRSLAREEAAI